MVSVIGAELGWMIAYFFAAALMLACFLYTTFCPTEYVFRFHAKKYEASPGSAIVAFLKRKKSWVTISFY